jgi:LCP family protein required for cell wall assembly
MSDALPDAAPSEPDPTSPKKGRWRRRRRNKTRRPRWLRYLIRGTVALLAVVLALGGAEAGYLAFVNHQIHRGNVPHLVKTATTGPNVGEQTFLLIGSTSRCVLNNKQATAFGSCAAGITGVNSDVIVLLHANPKTHQVSILSIPRDLALYNVRPVNQFYKIDAALADGPGQLVSVIEQNFGIPINHFVELNFDSFQNIVNALGGLKMDFPYRVFDDSSGLHIRTTGCVTMNGFQALALVRARNYWYFKGGKWVDDGTGDLGRIIRVHEFLRVLATAVEHRGLGNVLTDNTLLEAVAPNLEIDSTLSISDMVNLLRVFRSTKVDSVPQETMPNIENFAEYYFQGYDFGSVVLPTYPQDQQAVDNFLGLKRPPGSNIKTPSITVSVLNGTGVGDQATTTAAQLASLGYHVVGTGTSTPVGPISETIVYYKPGHILQAERLLKSLTGIVGMVQGTTDGGADVTVVTGSDFTVRVHPAKAKGGATKGGTTKGSSSSSTSTSTTSTSTTSTSTTSTSTTVTTTTQPSSLGPPSPAAQPLPSYDPRACHSG